MRFSKAVVKYRVLILIVALALLVPSAMGYLATRINYDMLTYLPKDMETVQGQDILLEDFGKGAFSILILEDMPTKDVIKLSEEIKKIDHVASVIDFDDKTAGSVPSQLLPKKVYDSFNNNTDGKNSTLMAVFFDTSTSADATMDTITAIRQVAGKQCFVTGMSAMVTDLKALCEREEPIYVGIAVALSCLAMLILLDGWLVPFVFLASIGIAIIINLGSNIFLGEISYITKALAAILQLAVTMDYSIFLWHSYNEQLSLGNERNDAMAKAIQETLTSVIGSSITTVAGFIALCFMSFTLGLDLGLVMAKGVLLGVIGSVTILPSLILILDKPLQRTRHRSILPDMKPFASGLLKVATIFAIVFAVMIYPAYRCYSEANNEVYYNLGRTLPDDIDYIIATDKLTDDFAIGSTHMILIDRNLPAKKTREMLNEMKEVDGVKFALGLESLLDPSVPEELLPKSVTSVLKSDKWELLLINSEYETATDEVNAQVGQINEILKKYDPSGLLIGEAPCTKDLIETTGTDFRVVNTVSIVAIFFIILLVERSLSLPIILISVIEFAIFCNLGLAHLMGQSLPFIAPICISTIQLGATVDYAILMTTRYKAERGAGNSRKDSVSIALSTSIPSILVSGMGLFAATFGVATYSDIDIISAICMLMARGAIISMLCVILILPALLLLFDGVIRHTTLGMRPKKSA